MGGEGGVALSATVEPSPRVEIVMVGELVGEAAAGSGGFGIGEVRAALPAVLYRALGYSRDMLFTRHAIHAPPATAGARRRAVKACSPEPQPQPESRLYGPTPQAPGDSRPSQGVLRVAREAVDGAVPDGAAGGAREAAPDLSSGSRGRAYTEFKRGVGAELASALALNKARGEAGGSAKARPEHAHKASTKEGKRKSTIRAPKASTIGSASSRARVLVWMPSSAHSLLRLILRVVDSLCRRYAQRLGTSCPPQCTMPRRDQQKCSQTRHGGLPRDCANTHRQSERSDLSAHPPISAERSDPRAF